VTAIFFYFWLFFYKWTSQIWGPSPKNGDTKISKFRQDFGQLCELIANISGLEEDNRQPGKRCCKLRSFPYAG